MPSPFESDWSDDTEWPAHDYVEGTDEKLNVEAARLLEGNGTILQPRPADLKLLDVLTKRNTEDPTLIEKTRKKLERWFRVRPK